MWSKELLEKEFLKPKNQLFLLTQQWDDSTLKAPNNHLKFSKLKKSQLISKQTSLPIMALDQLKSETQLLTETSRVHSSIFLQLEILLLGTTWKLKKKNQDWSVSFQKRMKQKLFFLDQIENLKLSTLSPDLEPMIWTSNKN